VISAALALLLIAIFAVAGSIANWLPHTAWFVALFVAAGAVFIFLLDRIARRYDL
jgi:hypothetical protein